MEEQHIHTVYEAKGGGYICSGCEKRFVDPYLHIGMGEPVAWMTKDQDPADFVPAWVRDEWVKDGGPTSEYFIPRYPTPLYANAHTKSVSIEAILEEVQRSGPGDLRARLLKLNQP